jgi:beta-phosphoglucomutase
MNIKCVLFDLDGVLVDACDWHYEALNFALEKELGFQISRQDHLVKYNGLPTSVKLKMLNIDPDVSQKIEALKQSVTLKIIRERSTIMPEKHELHSYLKSKNIKIACVTNSIRITAEEMLKNTGQHQFMDLIVSNEDVKNNKPYPDCYNFAVAKLEVLPENCLCVEDSPKGIKAATDSCVPNLWTVTNTNCVTLKNYLEVVK